MAMQIPPQEDWSPELLSELQRAVPVLESSSFELQQTPDGALIADGADAGNLWGALRPGRAAGSQDDAAGVLGHVALGLARAGGGRRAARDGAADGSLRLGDWASEGLHATGDGLGGGGSRTDPLADDAMALPMTTLTSGKRRTYRNRSTFQAHVCCVMDPLQVPRVLETLKSGSQFASARSWPHAYRIISPFDGQTHEDNDDDADPGAGEKMLGLLKRMGLENLLLIISHWDTGPTDRLGVELFRCINEQCKELLRELQQAVRASFPPDELLGSSRKDLALSAADGGDAANGHFQAFLSDGDDDDFQSITEYGLETADGSVFADDAYFGAQSPVQVEALGAAPPSDLVQAARGMCAKPPLRKRRPRPEPEDMQLLALPAPEDFEPVPDASELGFEVRPAPLAERLQGRAAGGAPCTVRVATWEDDSPDSGCFLTEPPSAAREATTHPGRGLSDTPTFFEDMSTKELVRLQDQLRSERLDLEGDLAKLARIGETPTKMTSTRSERTVTSKLSSKRESSTASKSRSSSKNGPQPPDAGARAKKPVSARAGRGAPSEKGDRDLPPRSARVPRGQAS